MSTMEGIKIPGNFSRYSRRYSFGNSLQWQEVQLKDLEHESIHWLSHLAVYGCSMELQLRHVHSKLT